jgi:hypothetical protein
MQQQQQQQQQQQRAPSLLSGLLQQQQQQPSLSLVRIVVWIRSNMAAYAVGMWRSSELTSGPCHSNNVRLKNAETCKLPSSNVTIPLSKFVEKLKTAQLYHAINLGSAFRHWAVPTAESCRGPHSQPLVYEMYYEAMLLDKQAEVEALLAWLGAPQISVRVCYHPTNGLVFKRHLRPLSSIIFASQH